VRDTPSRAVSRSSVWLAIRSLFWTVALPGFFAGYVPWRFFGLNQVRLESIGASQIPALACIGAGAVLLAMCIVEFARSGHGTLSPLDPPRELVVRGLYRYVRNPMYLSVTTIVLGEAMLTRHFARCSDSRTRTTLGAWDAGSRSFKAVSSSV